MRILAIETASEACSVALFEGGALRAHDHRILGRGHAERLVPMIAALPDKGEAQRIMVSLGPGSFTGVRIGIATARALGFAWQAEVLGYPTLALLAAMARSDPDLAAAGTGITVCTNGGHGEWFVQDFGGDGRPEATVASLTLDQASARAPRPVIAGNRAAELAALHEGAELRPLVILPDAARTDLLPAVCLTSDLTPIYGRGPDATPIAGRTAS
ncbi:tRNA (adenosine(37)-N6)-threonylcarbamoyltransferase complex dimerization subunit type 1 TsaB [Erythrobacter sp. JK5]|uniref:tRNA (adenosine(37)-N6)-threonylcarbamoyltransferase complex dimerization subunit type 1 TsaB n=1 Tax=Erythrobacter sp. JK5 TaxID=2829500 RepID=UPI001BA50A77|nr:tRNA (adenosine(37)-N6)-threonylcarbamoyltransferase complex dimerization subunit type 1 TsaB [Erythrobacter sp. JK5]QUL38323.1 tRNA (adenosine(37)-N6)-threonylcarbamoyltransferase complex dimerization subunit type 1 TsaB [Erythrobacter sp. JK5]